MTMHLHIKMYFALEYVFTWEGGKNKISDFLPYFYAIFITRSVFYVPYFDPGNNVSREVLRLILRKYKGGGINLNSNLFTI